MTILIGCLLYMLFLFFAMRFFAFCRECDNDIERMKRDK